MYNTRKMFNLTPTCIRLSRNNLGYNIKTYLTFNTSYKTFSVPKYNCTKKKNIAILYKVSKIYYKIYKIYWILEFTKSSLISRLANNEKKDKMINNRVAHS